MTDTKKQTFLKGAIILVCANALVKIIGAIFKIPLANLILEDGMGLFNTSYTMYTFMFVVATAGFPTAVSKMVAESVAVGKEKEADKIFSVAIVLLAVVGIIGSGALYFGASQFADWLGNKRAYLGIMAIAPAVLCVSLISAFRGYFQGHQNMYPTAISEVIEALGKLIIGYFLASMFIPKGIELAAAGAVFGVTCGTLLSFLALMLIFIMNKRNKSKKQLGEMRSYKKIAKELIVVAVPITIGASVASLTNVADMMTVMNRLQSITNVGADFINKYRSFIDFSVFNGGIYEELANKLYGLYSGYAVPLFNMPLTIVVALSMSVVPAIAGAIAKNDAVTAQKTTKSVIRITILFALPCAVGLSVLAGPILLLMFKSALAASLLQKLSIAIIFVSLLSVTSAILQSYGKMNIPVINMFIGGMVKVIINYYLVAIPSVNIEGAPIGTLVCYFLIVVLNFIWIIKVTGVKFGVMDFFIKPIIATAAMGVVVAFGFNFVTDLGVSVKIATLPAIAAGGIIYLVFIFLLGAITVDDVEMLPSGKKIAEKLKKIHLLR